MDTSPATHPAPASERRGGTQAPAERARDGFAAVFGREPAGVWSAPGRVNLIGEHTDYNGGLALPLALNRRTYAAIAPRADGLLRLSSADQPGEPVQVPVEAVERGRPGGWAAYVAGVWWALIRDGHVLPGADVHVVGDVPLGAGLSSSASLECAVAAGVSELAGLGLLADAAGRAALADACRVAENEIAGAPTGGMDQAAAMLARPGHALLLDFQPGSRPGSRVDPSDTPARQIPLDLDAAGAALLVVDTRATHALVDGQYAARRHTCEAAAATLGVATLREIAPSALASALDRLPDPVSRARVRHVVTEIARVGAFVAALEVGDLAVAGELMVASHASLRDDYEVSCAELDLVVSSALDAGAMGARMTGGGFGGCAIVLVSRDDLERVRCAVHAAFADAGLQPPESFTAIASDAAHRDS